MDFNFLQKDIMYSPKRFFNRELSLLKFHGRVLEESFRVSLPLLERLRFLAISGSNLDEFCMVRFAGLKSRRANEENISIDGQSFKEQTKNAYKEIKRIKKRQFEAFSSLRKELAKENFHILSEKELSKKSISKLEAVFTQEILPELAVFDFDKKIPFLANQTINILVLAGQRHKIISIPKTSKRFIPVSETKNKVSFIAIEKLVSLFLHKVIDGEKNINKLAVFNIIRDNSIEFYNKSDNIIAWFENALEKRKQGKFSLIDILDGCDEDTENFLKKKFKLEESDIVRSGFLGYLHLQQLIIPFRGKMLFKEYAPRKSEQIKKANNDYFEAIEKEDILVHHPYESYEIVVNFLNQAAKDIDVISIKQTIYRTNKESPIMYALMEAAKNGKDVTAYIELRARFDEAANLNWAKIMESYGVKVVFGHPEYKSHCKISLVRRKVKNKIKSYVHYGTGNYNPVTANIYTDLSYFTSDEDLCNDAEAVFNLMETQNRPDELKKLIISPFDSRDSLLALIEKEIEFANAGKPATIWAKANSLMDDVIIDAFYKASKAGVKINLIIRGICSLRPGIKGLSENIKVKSIVGRFLEHSRIYCFGNGKKMAPTNAKVFISSADLMRRNMIKRVETMVPIEKTKIKKQILNQIMYANIKDNKNSWILDEDMNYHRESKNAEAFGAQEFFMHNPSLAVKGSSAKLKRKVKSTR